MEVCIAHGGDLSQPSGGVDRITAFAEGLQREGVEVTVVTPRPTDSVPQRLADIELVTVPVQKQGVLTQPVRAALVVHRARKIARTTGADLQIEHSTLGGAATLLGCSGFVLDMHDLAFASPLYGDLPLGRALQRGIKWSEKRAARHASHIVTVSNPMQAFLTEEWGVPEARVTVISNGYFHDRIDPYRGTDTVEGRVVFLGTLHPNIDIDAFVAISRSPAVNELVVIGDGPRRDTLENFRTRHDLSAIRLMGRLPHERAIELTASAAVAVNPQRDTRTYTMSSPVKLYTYAALGVAIVATEGPEVGARLQESGSAVLVPTDGDFAGSVQELLQDDSRRQSMADNGIAVSAGRTWADRAEDLVAHYG